MSTAVLFKPIPLEPNTGVEWGSRVAHYLKPQTLFADRLAHAMERAWELTRLAAEVLKDPQPELAGPVIRRTIELATDLDFLRENMPERIAGDDRETVATGMELVEVGVIEACEAFTPAMFALDNQLRDALANANTFTRADLELLEELRETWEHYLQVLATEPEDEEHPLVVALRETVDRLDEALA